MDDKKIEESRFMGYYVSGWPRNEERYATHVGFDFILKENTKINAMEKDLKALVIGLFDKGEYTEENVQPELKFYDQNINFSYEGISNDLDVPLVVELKTGRTNTHRWDYRMEIDLVAENISYHEEFSKIMKNGVDKLVERHIQSGGNVECGE